MQGGKGVLFGLFLVYTSVFAGAFLWEPEWSPVVLLPGAARYPAVDSPDAFAAADLFPTGSASMDNIPPWPGEDRPRQDNRPRRSHGGRMSYPANYGFSDTWRWVLIVGNEPPSVCGEQAFLGIGGAGGGPGGAGAGGNKGHRSRKVFGPGSFNPGVQTIGG